MKVAYALMGIACLLAITGVYSSSAQIQEEYRPHVLFVEIDDGNAVFPDQFYVMNVKTAVYAPVSQTVVVAIYVQDPDLTPAGVMLFKTKLLAGETPIEFGFTIPNQCAYNSLIHGHICSKDIPRTVYVNIFSDYLERGGISLAPEFVLEESK